MNSFTDMRASIPSAHRCHPENTKIKSTSSLCVVDSGAVSARIKRGPQLSKFGNQSLGKYLVNGAMEAKEETHPPLCCKRQMISGNALFLKTVPPFEFG